MHTLSSSIQNVMSLTKKKQRSLVFFKLLLDPHIVLEIKQNKISLKPKLRDHINVTDDNTIIKNMTSKQPKYQLQVAYTSKDWDSLCETSEYGCAPCPLAGEVWRSTLSKGLCPGACITWTRTLNQLRNSSCHHINTDDFISRPEKASVHQLTFCRLHGSWTHIEMNQVLTPNKVSWNIVSFQDIWFVYWLNILKILFAMSKA